MSSVRSLSSFMFKFAANRAIYTNGGKKAYPGEVFLFSPISVDERGKATPSMGMVAVKKEGDCHDWRFMTKDTDTVDLSLANTVCRQRGFTGANPSFIFTHEEIEMYTSYNFSAWDDLM